MRIHFTQSGQIEEAINLGVDAAEAFGGMDATVERPGMGLQRAEAVSAQ